MVAAPDLGSGAERRGGSSPFIRTVLDTNIIQFIKLPGMQITKEDTGKLTASVRLLIGKEDYEDKVMKTLKDYQRKTNMPGFRPGKVPFGLVSKIYRKGVLLDEIHI